MTLALSVESSTARVKDLQSSFEAFSRISKDLERSYDRLREQAAQVDVALAESNRRLAEKVGELDELSSNLKAVLGSLRASVIVTDGSGRITLVNRAMATLLELSMEQLKGRLKHELRDANGEPVSDPAPGPTPLARVIRTASGTQRVVRSSIAPIQSQKGEVLGEVEILVDETEIEVLRQELRQKETFSALGEMAAGIAHEIRNPLGAIEGFAALLQRHLPEGNPKCLADARRIMQGVRQANTIITNLLCFARPEKFRPRQVRVASVLDSLCNVYRGTVPEVRVEMPPPQLEVSSDPALLERLLVNLIENARAVLKDGESITLKAWPEGGEVLISVEDEGPGIPVMIQDRIFLPFVTGRPEGTGLGLAIVRRIVDLHHGRISARPREGGGTVFTVSLQAQTTRSRHRASQGAQA